MAKMGVRTKLVLVAFPLGVCAAGWLGLWWFHREYMMPDHGQQKVRLDIGAIVEAMDAWSLSHGGTHPVTLDVLVAPDDHGHRYLGQTNLPRDPWGREYVYVPGNPPNVLTHGRDGVGKWDGGGRGS